MNLTTRINPADIVFPSEESAPAPKPSAAAALDIDAVLHAIWQRLGECGTSNQNTRVIIAIKDLIGAGVNTAPRIIGATRSLGFKRAHVGAILKTSVGDHWRCDANGVYSL